MISPFNLSDLILNTIFILPILYLFTRYILKPFLRLRSLGKQGFDTDFFPVLGFHRNWILDLKYRGDLFASTREQTKTRPNQKVLVTNHGSDIVFILYEHTYKKIFLQNQQYYDKTGFSDFMRPLLGTGLLFAKGEAWKRHRKLVSTAFHYESLKGSVGLIRETAQEFLRKITPDQYQNFPIIEKMQEITGEVVGRFFFGKSFCDYTFEGQPITLALAELLGETTSYGFKLSGLVLGIDLISVLPSYRTAIQRVQKLKKLCLQIIQDKRNQEAPTNDLLSFLLATQTDSEQSLTDEEILDEFLTLFAAGMDTTGHLVGMALYNLHLNQENVPDLTAEREEIYKNHEGELTIDHLQKMEFLHCFLKETLRFHTPAPGSVPRLALEDHKIGDLEIKKGDQVRVEILSAFFDENIFEDAQKFDPQRWKNAEKMDSWIFTPFSAGPRNCIGQHLAMVEAKIIISEFLNMFNYKLQNGYKLRLCARFLYEPVDKVLFDLTPKTM